MSVSVKLVIGTHAPLFMTVRVVASVFPLWKSAAGQRPQGLQS